MTTVTTVGYGDKYPLDGRRPRVAVAVMILGIAAFGMVTAKSGRPVHRRAGRRSATPATRAERANTPMETALEDPRRERDAR